MNLKQKTLNGLFWSFIDTIAGQGIVFIVSLILARILSPKEFGLIGMITIFIAISQSIINSGFNSALIRKPNCSSLDYSTVFYFNVATGIALYIFLFFLAPSISAFFREPQLSLIVRVLGIVLIVDSLTMIQRTILIKRIDFKLQAKISLISSIGSGIIAISFAYLGIGVWALVIQIIVKQALDSFFFWIWNRWSPIFFFSKKSFKELFGFGSKLLLSGLIDTIFRNIYYVVIGKYFTAQSLGYYTKAEDFNKLPSQNLNSIIARVTFPILSNIQDDIPKLKSAYQRLVRSIMFITFPLMLGMAAIADPLIKSLIGEKWSPSALYLQLLCFVGMMYPLHALNLNMLQVQGRSDIFLKLEVIKKTIAIPTIVIGIFYGIEVMIIGMILNSFFAFYLNSYWSGKKIGYSFKNQFLDILPSFFLASTSALIVYLIGKLLQFSSVVNLFIQLFVGIGVFLSICEILRMREYVFIKSLLLEYIKIFKKK